MRRMMLLLALLLWALPAAADTYSWVDDQGTWNFSEDLSSVPKKYRKKAQRRSDLDSLDQPASPVKADSARSAEPAAAKSGAEKKDGVAPAGKEVYGGKTFDAWRAEFGQHEAGLRQLEQQLEGMRAVLGKAEGLSVADRARMTTEYNSLRSEYDAKYAVYKELLDSARKAGLAVDIKK